MASLLDIAPARETVDVGGAAIEVKAISAEEIVGLIQRFGNVFEVLGGDVSQAGAALKPVLGAVIAAGVGKLGSAEFETHAAEMSIGNQATILAAIRRLTMPRGVRPFLADLSALGLPLDGFVAALDQMASAANLPEASSS